MGRGWEEEWEMHEIQSCFGQNLADSLSVLVHLLQH